MQQSGIKCPMILHNIGLQLLEYDKCKSMYETNNYKMFNIMFTYKWFLNIILQ